MMKHRGLMWGLGLIAALGLSAREAKAAPMMLTVYLDGSSIYSTSGDNVSVTADTDALNSALNGTAYTFSGLSGSSNFPGTSGPVGGFISVAGNVSYDPAIGGNDFLTIVVSESGFTSPSSGAGNMLVSTATANYSGTGAGSAGPPLGPTYQTYVGDFADSSSPTPVTAATPTITQLSNGTAADGHTDSTSAALGPYLTTYTLTGTTTIAMNASSTSPSNNVFTNKTSVVPAVPEPASLVMMVTGMPLPLVVMGLLRRRRGTA